MGLVSTPPKDYISTACGPGYMVGLVFVQRSMQEGKMAWQQGLSIHDSRGAGVERRHSG